MHYVDSNAIANKFVNYFKKYFTYNNNMVSVKRLQEDLLTHVRVINHGAPYLMTVILAELVCAGNFLSIFSTKISTKKASRKKHVLKNVQQSHNRFLDAKL